MAQGADDYEDIVDMDGCEGIVNIEDMNPQEWRRAKANGRYRTPYRIKRNGQKGRTQTSYVLRIPYSSDPKRRRSAVPTMVNMLLLDKQTHWEAASIFYWDNIFFFRSINACKAFLKDRDKLAIKCLRDIQVDLSMHRKGSDLASKQQNWTKAFAKIFGFEGLKLEKFQVNLREYSSHGGYVPLVSQILAITPQKMQWTSSTSYGKVIYDVLGLGSMTDGLAVPNGVGGHRIKDCVAARVIKAWTKAISRSTGSSAVFEQALERGGPTPDQELDWLLAGLYEMIMRPSRDTYGDGTLLVFPGFTIKERDVPEAFGPVSDEVLRDKGYRVLGKEYWITDSCWVMRFGH